MLALLKLSSNKRSELPLILLFCPARRNYALCRRSTTARLISFLRANRLTSHPISKPRQRLLSRCWGFREIPLRHGFAHTRRSRRCCCLQFLLARSTCGLTKHRGSSLLPPVFSRRKILPSPS